MTLLAPLFLLGLGALMVPVLVHLIHKHQKEALRFPSLMFIQRIPYKDVRRQQLRHKFLFALRCLALLLIAIAFARPFFQQSAQAAVLDDGGREVVILVDQSHSMQYGDHWDRAVEQAHAAVDALGPTDRGTVVFFAERAQAVGQSTTDIAALKAAIDAAEPTAGATRFGPALQLAGRVLSESEQPDLEVVLISDFQRSGWDRMADVRLPGGTTVTPVDLSEGEIANLSVAFVSVRQDAESGQQRALVSTRIVNGGGEAVAGVPVSLVLNGQQVQQQSVDLEPHGSEAVTFSPVLLPQGLSRGVVRAGTDALPEDNEFRFVLTPSNSLSALILEGSNARQNQSLYLRRALAIGDRPSFRVDVRPLRQFRLSDLDGRALVVLNEAPFPTGEAGRRIREFVEAGGGLLVALGEANGPGAWPAEIADMIPGTVGERVDPARGPTALATLEYGSPVFDVFSAPRSGDFASAKFFRYRRLSLPEQGSVLARFSDGQPALAEHAVGDGLVLVWTSTLDTHWNELALQPVYLPFVHRVARHISGYEEVRTAFTVGEVVELAGDTPDPLLRALWRAGRELVVEAPSGARQVVMPDDARHVVELPENGFFEIRQLEPGSVPPTVVAANLDPRESDIARLDLEEFLGSVVPFETAGGVPARVRELTVQERERRQQLWWYLLVAALLVLMAETALSNRLSRVA